MRTVLVIASAIVNAILRAAHTATRTGQAPGGARCAAVRVLGKHRAVPGAQRCASLFLPHGERNRADRGASQRSACRAAGTAPAHARRAPDPAPLHARARDAEPEVWAADRTAGAREAAPALAPSARRAGLRGPRL